MLPSLVICGSIYEPQHERCFLAYVLALPEESKLPECEMPKRKENFQFRLGEALVFGSTD